MKYEIKIYYGNNSSNVQYITDVNEKRLKENLPKLISDKLPIIVDTDNGFVVLNPEKVACIEVKELDK